MTQGLAVIFDMDGVVLDSEPIYRACWQRAARELGFEVSDELYTKVIGRKDSDSEAVLASALGEAFSLAQFRDRWPRYWEDHVRANRIPPKPGLTELLDFLEQRRIPKAIATSTERDKALLSLRDLLGRFDAMVTGDEIERGKPAPDIFLRAADRLGVAPRSCWVVEDSEPGVQAAHAAGMKAVVVPDLKEPSSAVLALAERVCSSLAELQQILTKELR